MEIISRSIAAWMARMKVSSESTESNKAGVIVIKVPFAMVFQPAAN